MVAMTNCLRNNLFPDMSAFLTVKKLLISMKSNCFVYFSNYFGVIELFWTQVAHARPGSSTWSTMPPTTSWSEPRPWWRTASSSSTASHTGSGMRVTTPLLWGARREPSWYVGKHYSRILGLWRFFLVVLWYKSYGVTQQIKLYIKHYLVCIQ